MSIRADVDRGVAIIKEVAKLKKELESIDARLIDAGLHGPQTELEDPELEGRQYLAKGEGHIVPVVFTSDLLVKTFAAESAQAKKIEAVVGGQMDAFFAQIITRKTLFDSGKTFRAKAAEILGDKGPELVTACVARDKHGIPKSQQKVEWARAKALTE
jgi:hypothetical protein